jgi:DNA repair protein RecN (Recombination protein N)
MLRHLRIRNLAVIEAVEVHFEPGFNVLTGETGAGKSILIEAVGLLLGGRASSDLVRTGESQATVEALFEMAKPLPDLGREILIRREIGRHGRSRAFVNQAPATAADLRVLATQLVELHGQHEHQALLDPSTHLPALDAFAKHEDSTSAVATCWHEVQSLRERLARCQMDGREKAVRLELVAFQLGEIEGAAPKAGEDEELAARRKILASAERVQRLCQESYDALYDGDGAVLSVLGGVWKRVGELGSLDPSFMAYVESRDGIKGQLEDLALFLRDYMAGVDASPATLQDVEDRLAVIERLKRKFGPTLDDVLTRGRSLASERESLGGAGEHQADIEEKLGTASARFLTAAKDLSSRRRAAALVLAGQLEEALGGLAMMHTRFQVRFSDRPLSPEHWGVQGIDEVEFFVSPNLGEDLRALARVVSGGELSRVMLALKTLALTDAPATTVVFDEVDAGIGGRVAGVVGERLGSLGDQFQVLCITHLPQIAAHAATHFRIEKAVKKDRTVTTVERLDAAARIDELARMLGGGVLSDQVRGSAEDLLFHASSGRWLENNQPNKRIYAESERRKRKAKTHGA